MLENNSIEQGWAFTSRIVGANIGADLANVYVNNVNTAIDSLYKALIATKSEAPDASVGGFAAEAWHAGTFNINAVAAGSKSRAVAGQPGTAGDLGRNISGSVDVRITTGSNENIDYGLKYMVNARETAKGQAHPSAYGDRPKYEGQQRLVPSDQLEDVRAISAKNVSESQTPENWKRGYEETEKLATDHMSDGKSKSKPLSKQEDLEIAKEVKNDELDLNKHGVNTNDAIHHAYVMKQAAEAGLSAAMVTMIMQTAPEIFKSIDYLIKNKKIDMQQIKRTGEVALSSTAEGFLRGSVACALQVYCQKGAFGLVLQKAVSAANGPMVLGTVVALTIQTVKNSLLVAAGKLTQREMNSALVDTVIISGGYLVGAQIGGIIGQTLGFQLPVIGYLLGSLIGASLAVVYEIGKKKLISFCVESGFTCFGLVEQDYKLPEGLLREMGIDFTPVNRTEISKTAINQTLVSKNANFGSSYETVDIRIVSRGIIGVNKVGYVY